MLSHPAVAVSARLQLRERKASVLLRTGIQLLWSNFDETLSFFIENLYSFQNSKFCKCKVANKKNAKIYPLSYRIYTASKIRNSVSARLQLRKNAQRMSCHIGIQLQKV